MDTKNGILSGKIDADGEYTLRIRAENTLGTDSKTVRLVIAPDTRCLTPLLGWTSWNAMRQFVSHEKITHVADRLVESGLADYGYQYVNIDSGWQGVYGGKFGAVVASPAFPDMAETVAHIHSYGLKAGIYSTPAEGVGRYRGSRLHQGTARSALQQHVFRHWTGPLRERKRGAMGGLGF